MTGASRVNVVRIRLGLLLVPPPRSARKEKASGYRLDIHAPRTVAVVVEKTENISGGRRPPLT